MDNILEPRQLWQLIQKYFFAFFVMAILGASVGYATVKFGTEPTYSASTSMLVNRSDVSTNTDNLSDQQQADVQLINTYKNLISSSNVLGTVSHKLAHPAPVVVKKAKPAVYETLADGTKRLVTPAQKEVTRPSTKNKYNLSVAELKSMVSVSTQQNSQVFSITVVSTNAQLAADVANEVAAVFKDKIGGFMKINNVSIVDSAAVNNQPVGPNVRAYIVKGLIIFVGLTLLYVLIKELTDTAIKSPDEVSQLFGMTNLGVIGHIKPIKNFSMNTAYSRRQSGVRRSRLGRSERL